MRQKVNLTPEQIYKKNQQKAKMFKTFAPIIFWVFIALSLFFFLLMIRNSVGNITEIIDLLDKEKLTGEQVEQNYKMLVEKWGKWTIVGKENSLMNVEFIDIRKAFFSGLMITYMTLGIVFLALAIILGKILFPKLSQYFSDNNQDMVNIATLQTNAEILNQKKEKEKQWF